ncbi:MAG TPA: PIG-L family deacetylase [Vicinamibacterales bacterium]|nr:PIG-L family deacetylase [Vicinamibacterales bacterium]
MQIIAFGAHPDDCEFSAGGTAAKWAAAGHRVRFVALTNGAAGHHAEPGPGLAGRRRAEAEEAGRRAGIDAHVLDVPDGALFATLELRERVIRLIREWRADLVLGHRPNDYHPDHRQAAALVQDAAYLVTVPGICPDTPALTRNPVFMYFQDRFTKPTPFSADVAVDIDDAMEAKVMMLDAHASQVYEFLAWQDGVLHEVPATAEARRAWLRRRLERPVAPAVREALARRYGAARAAAVRNAEAFEICEYGRQPGPDELAALFPL